jgi:hypothetical protein
MDRFGFQIVTDNRSDRHQPPVDAAYRPIQDGRAYIVLEVPRLPPHHNRIWGHSGRYWPARCRVVKFSLEGSGLGSFSMKEWDLPPIPEAVRLEDETAIEIIQQRERKAGGPVAPPLNFRPWTVVLGGEMRGPPHFEDFLMEWDSPMSLMLEDSMKVSGWEKIRFPKGGV